MPGSLPGSEEIPHRNLAGHFFLGCDWVRSLQLSTLCDHFLVLFFLLLQAKTETFTGIPLQKNSGNPTENFLLKTNNYLKTWPNTLPTNLSVSHHFPTPSKTKDTSLQNSLFKSTILIIKDVLDLSRLLVRVMIVMNVKKSNVLTLDQLCLEILHVTFWQSQRHGSWFILEIYRNFRWMCSGSMVDRHLAKQLGWPTIALRDVANSHDALLSTFHLPTF